jgi:carboxypeptidase C (cathepsin A)
MRRFISLLVVVPLFLFPCAAQQSSESKSAPDQNQNQKKTKKETPSQKPAEPKKPEQASAKSTEPAPSQPEPKPGDDKKEEKFDLSEIAPVVTHHQTTHNGKTLKYTATAGRLPIKRGDGRIEAEMFFVAYTLDGADSGKRPLTFAFNGGPGSASIWLHMGALGPRRVVLNADGSLPPAPYRLEDNANTLLDKSDLVFVDAIGTGYSRGESAELSKKFWSVKGDVQSFSEFIRTYISRYERWTSPLFLFGESYGTTRSAGIAGLLAEEGISFNGITLLSIAIDFQTLEDSKTNDEPYILLIPTFTMIAGYHHKLAPDLQQDLAKARQEAEQWASGEYTQALAKGDALTGQERQQVIEHMARFTGLNKDVLDQANLRIDVAKFTHFLLIDQKVRVGRLDGRFTGTDPDGLLDTPFYDPTEANIVPPYTTAFNNYVRNDLGYKVDMPYYVFPREGGGFKWNWGSAEEGLPSTAMDLRHAIVRNPYLKIMVMEGYYDLATPYYAANYTMQHLDLPEKFRSNISYATFQAGHMVYLPADGVKKMKTDEAGFIDSAVPAE